jgi:hypothetical protein
VSCTRDGFRAFVINESKDSCLVRGRDHKSCELNSSEITIFIKRFIR